MTVWPGAAPRQTRPSSSPMVLGRSSQRSSQPRISRPPHSSSTKRASRSPVTRSGRPSELPSKYTRSFALPTKRSRSRGQGVVAVELLGSGHALSSVRTAHYVYRSGNGKPATPPPTCPDHPSGGFRWRTGRA